ncbi:CBO0543 family protein [Paenibacillus illinoisensis]|uniref:CBO0543 family protein n=1 Tax=Paenibacillus illinoisensis TaxID=59845 RepID=UPI0035C88EF9
MGCWILRKNLNLILFFFPLGIAVSAVVNNIGFNYFWHLLPEFNNHSFSALPFDLGLFPTAGCLLIYYIKQRQAHPWLAVVVSALVLTIVEWIAKASGKLLYLNDWNIAWTYISYLLPMAIAYGYSTIFYRVLKSFN